MPLLLIIPLFVAAFMIVIGSMTTMTNGEPSDVEPTRLQKTAALPSLEKFFSSTESQVGLFTRFSSSLSPKNFVQLSPASPSINLSIPARIATPADPILPSQSSSALSSPSLGLSSFSSSQPFTTIKQEAPLNPSVPQEKPVLLERYSAKAELFCYGANCLDTHFLGNIDIILNHEMSTLSFDQISLESTNGVFLRGNIIFSKGDDPVASGLTSMLYLTDNLIKLEIMGESAAHYQWPEDGHHGFAEFQMRDANLDLILNLISDIPPQ